MKVLLVKMSSLGDVVHTLPAVADAHGHGHEFHWVVEEAFQDVPKLHPAVTEVIPIAWRRWRKRLVQSRSELSAFGKALRSQHYDVVLDAQGLFKSAIVASFAKGPRVGLDRQSAREGGSALFYQRRVSVPRQLHAIDRLRRLFAECLGYTVDTTNVVSVVPVAAERNKHVVLLHGTTWHNKHWPEPMWVALADQFSSAGFDVLLPSGNAAERDRAERIAGVVANSRALGGSSIGELAELLASARIVIGVDSGLSHLAGILGAPTVTLYGPTDSALTGCRGVRATNLSVEFGCAPCLNRQCLYKGAEQLWHEQPVQPACFATLTPERVWQEAQALMNRDTSGVE